MMWVWPYGCGHVGVFLWPIMLSQHVNGSGFQCGLFPPQVLSVRSCSSMGLFLKLWETWQPQLEGWVPTPGYKYMHWLFNLPTSIAMQACCLWKMVSRWEWALIGCRVASCLMLMLYLHVKCLVLIAVVLWDYCASATVDVKVQSFNFNFLFNTLW